ARILRDRLRPRGPFVEEARRRRPVPLPPRRGQHALRRSGEGAPQARVEAGRRVRRAGPDDGRRGPPAPLMKALVTGALGFVGRHLTAALRDAGWRVLTADRRGPADLVGDLLTVPFRGVSVDVVFHLAGFANPAASVADPAAAYAGNAAVT